MEAPETPSLLLPYAWIPQKNRSHTRSIEEAASQQYIQLLCLLIALMGLWQALDHKLHPSLIEEASRGMGSDALDMNLSVPSYIQHLKRRSMQYLV